MAEKITSVFRRGLLNHKVAIVTGGATGIGNAITKELLYLGCNVVIASRKMENLVRTENELNDRFPPRDSLKRVSAFQCNIRKEDEVEKELKRIIHKLRDTNWGISTNILISVMLIKPPPPNKLKPKIILQIIPEVKSLMKSVVSRYGKIDFLVNNGGGQFPSPAADISLKGWNAVVETNLTGTFLMCREAYHASMKDNGGSIVTIITDMWKGWPNMSHSGAARSGVDNLTKTLAVEWAQDGIRINAVAPGSSIYSSTASANYANVDPEIFTRTIPFVPAKRLGTVEEVSAAVVFLLSPAAAFISGETVKVDAGGSLYGQSFWTIPEHKKLPAYTWSDDVDAQEVEGVAEVPKSKL